MLSMSKHIMNYVFGCASGCNVNICYQSTDSIHLHYDDVDNTVKM